MSTRIDIVSLFPEMFAGPFGCSIVKRAVDKGILEIGVTNPRAYAYDKHRMVDDAPFGGGDGMVLKPEPFFRAVRRIVAARPLESGERRRIVLLCPSGATFTQAKAKELAACAHLVFVCGHYEGFDARIAAHIADEAVSIGDYVLTGGELPAMVVIDALARMIPGVLGAEGSAATDSFYEGLLQYPQYTRPRVFEGLAVPEVLLSGDHARIAAWRMRQALQATWLKRPDLLEKAALSPAQQKLLAEVQAEGEGEE